MNILVTNDDGIIAEGIAVLEKALQTIGKVVVVAPVSERSACGHSISLDSPITLHKVGVDKFSCESSPADCVIAGLLGDFTGVQKFDLVCSGINRGANTAQDVYYSGTVSAAREAAARGGRGVAISSAIDITTYKHGDKIEYETAAAVLLQLFEVGLINELKPFEYLNINVPNLPFYEVCGVEIPLGTSFRKYEVSLPSIHCSQNKLYFHMKGQYHGYTGDINTDCGILDRKKVSVELVNLLGLTADRLECFKEFINKVPRG